MTYYNDNHPIDQIMKSAMSSLKTMIDTNTVIGSPIKTPDGVIIIPVSKVTVGFVAGGGEFAPKISPTKHSNPDFPFAGGSSSGFNILPMAFLIKENDTYKVLPINPSEDTSNLFDLVAKAIELFSSDEKNNQPPQEEVFEKEPQNEN